MRGTHCGPTAKRNVVAVAETELRRLETAVSSLQRVGIELDSTSTTLDRARPLLARPCLTYCVPTRTSTEFGLAADAQPAP